MDAILRRYRLKHGGEAEPEARLQAVWLGAAVLPAGLLIYGFGIAYKIHWAMPAVGMGMACFGLQIIATVCFTYTSDCYKVSPALSPYCFDWSLSSAHNCTCCPSAITASNCRHCPAFQLWSPDFWLHARILLPTSRSQDRIPVQLPHLCLYHPSSALARRLVDAVRTQRQGASGQASL